MSSGERPIGAAKGKQSDTEALCQPPPPLRCENNALSQATLSAVSVNFLDFWIVLLSQGGVGGVEATGNRSVAQGQALCYISHIGGGAHPPTFSGLTNVCVKHVGAGMGRMPRGRCSTREQGQLFHSHLQKQFPPQNPNRCPHLLRPAVEWQPV